MPLPPVRSLAQSVARSALALGIGFAGALLFVRLGLPLPWMLGAMAACLTAAMAGVPLRKPEPLNKLMRVVLGVVVGAAFTPAIGAAVPGMLASLAFVVPYVALLGLIGVPYFRRVAGYDPPTAYFAAMPGGLPDMTAIGREMGGDEAKLALVHGTRVLLVVFSLPFLIETWEGIDLGAGARFGVPLAEAGVADQAFLLVCGLAGWWGGVRLGITGATIVGPMLVSAAVHLAGLTEARPPDEIVKAAQLVLGAGIGCAFVGVRPRDLLRTAALTLGLVGLMFVATAGVAALVHAITGVALVSVLLAYVPGGQGEMNLIALSRGEDIAFVAVHHLVRVSVIVAGAPVVFRRLGRAPPSR